MIWELYFLYFLSFYGKMLKSLIHFNYVWMFKPLGSPQITDQTDPSLFGIDKTMCVSIFWRPDSKSFRKALSAWPQNRGRIAPPPLHSAWQTFARGVVDTRSVVLVEVRHKFVVVWKTYFMKILKNKWYKTLANYQDKTSYTKDFEIIMFIMKT